jgi:hypothetical protein
MFVAEFEMIITSVIQLSQAKIRQSSILIEIRQSPRHNQQTSNHVENEKDIYACNVVILSCYLLPNRIF